MGRVVSAIRTFSAAKRQGESGMFARSRKTFLVFGIALAAMLMILPIPIQAQSILQEGLDYPFPDPENWEIINGYNDRALHGSVVGTYDYFYAYYAFDFARENGQTAGSTVYLPADVYYFRMQRSSELCVDFSVGEFTGDYDFYLEMCHINFTSLFTQNRGLVVYQFLPRGTVIGTVANTGDCPNCNPPHIHMAAHVGPEEIPWDGDDFCGASPQWLCRIPLPFQSFANFSLALGGHEYPPLEDNLFQNRGQYDNSPTLSGGGSSEGSYTPTLTQSDPWLLIFSKGQKPPIEVQIHTLVDAPAGVYDAHRVLYDGNVLFETSAAEFFYTWNTSGWPDGEHTLAVEYRVLSDGGNWANADRYEEQFYLSPDRNVYAPCDGGDGVTLTSGSDCIRVTEDVVDLGPAGWSDRWEVTACTKGNLEAWLYDGVPDQYGNYGGVPKIVKDGECKSVGGNVSSIDLRPPSSSVPPIPDAPFEVDANTVHLYRFDEGSGSTVSDSAGSLNGSVSSGNSWVPGNFGSAMYFPNPNDGRGVTFSPINICPITFEAWLRAPSPANAGRIAVQQGGGGNSGSNKWALYFEGRKLKLEVWSGGGSNWVVGFQELSTTDWHYVMVTYDCGTAAKLYLDNELMGTLNTASQWNSGATTLEIGSAEGVYRCNCEVDEVRISSIVRSPQVTPTPIPTITPTPTPIPTPTPTETPTPQVAGTFACESAAFINEGSANLWGQFFLDEVFYDEGPLDPSGLVELPLGLSDGGIHSGRLDYWPVGQSSQSETLDLGQVGPCGATPTQVPTPTETLTVTPTPTPTPTPTVTPEVSGVELLTDGPLHLAGNDGASEAYQSIDPYALQGMDMLRVTLDLHGLEPLCGDASALIFDQNGWQYVSLCDYVQPGLNGEQTVEIPLSNFIGLNLSEPAGTLHTRFWYGSVFVVDITSIVGYNSQ